MMLFQKKYMFVMVVILLLSSAFITMAQTVFASESIVNIGIDEPSASIPGYHASLTYAEYAGLTEASKPPSYHASLTYAEYAGLTQPTNTIPSYHASLTYAEYSGLIQPSESTSYKIFIHEQE